MSKGRKTKVLQYNLHNRGRKHTGVDRSNIDFMSMINLINAPSTQEMVKTGQLIGFYGHQIRQRFGMVPPESVPISGKMVHLEPAFRTIEIKADKDGTVSHRAEFLENESGEFARTQYLAKVGGFSTAVNYRKTPPNKLTPSGFFGFDYVTQPNYATNVGDGQLFDGLFVPEDPSNNLIACFDSATDLSALEPSQALIANMLEQQIISTFDSIHAQITLGQMNEQALDQIDALTQQISLHERKKQLQQQRQQDLYTGMVGEIRTFDSALAEAEHYLEQLEGNLVQDNTKQRGTGLVKTVRKFLTFGG
ncbi:hypothetical protein GCM10023206_07080 [Acinetobacter puyangensis]|uniref:Uncharacterized protein n=1 Tax=Acinetobacter puyangensis TaxID=1096779 RepID=A0A240E6I5_9GAMM|nr:hypothetical protein [Acinetobacter puyangensis]SNX44212.1 hypothetical protein SAMN05421731_102373 [Acinetobacter puyangensis]